VAGLSPWRPRFDARPDDVEFLVDKGTLRQVSKFFGFSLSVKIHTHILLKGMMTGMVESPCLNGGEDQTKLGQQSHGGRPIPIPSSLEGKYPVQKSTDACIIKPYC
jgi:hypothetical protein